ncbi:MAG: hypothetical protein ABIO55_08585 [Ginsengibacter sp.]
MLVKSIFTIIRFPVVAVVVILYVHYFFPQSWGFYTTEARLPLYNIYNVHSGITDKIPFLKVNMSYGMGISLKGRIIYNELYSIIDKDNLPWKDLAQDSLNYITQHGNYILTSTGSEYAALRGNFLITKTNRPSYLMLKKGEKFHQLRQYILVNIR